MKRTLELENKLSELTRLLDVAEEFLESGRVPVPVQYKIKLVFDEMFSNIVSYGYRPEDPPDRIRIEMSLKDKKFTGTLDDGGISFNPLEQDHADTTLPAEERPIGGLGIHLVRNLTHELSYKRKKNRNVFCFSMEIE